LYVSHDAVRKDIYCPMANLNTPEDDTGRRRVRSRWGSGLGTNLLYTCRRYEGRGREATRTCFELQCGKRPRKCHWHSNTINDFNIGDFGFSDDLIVLDNAPSGSNGPRSSHSTGFQPPPPPDQPTVRPSLDKAPTIPIHRQGGVQGVR